MTDLTPDELALSRSFAPAPKRPWLTPALLGLATFAITAVAIRGAAERQAPILDSMEIQPFVAAASLAYAWGSADDAVALERQVLALAERARGTSAQHAVGEPDFDTLRKTDADLARFKLAVLENAPSTTFQALCAQATIRCNAYNLERLVEMVKKQRVVATAPTAAR
ncbi:MAG TPA: hypothetical protein VMI54_02760 [Polyangiaceae bacterium]|nr:hypothetical protein [Polyangiaceae bacterium]